MHTHWNCLGTSLGTISGESTVPVHWPSPVIVYRRAKNMSSFYEALLSHLSHASAQQLKYVGMVVCSKEVWYYLHVYQPTLFLQFFTTPSTTLTLASMFAIHKQGDVYRVMYSLMDPLTFCNVGEGKFAGHFMLPRKLEGLITEKIKVNLCCIEFYFPWVWYLYHHTKFQ